jgi:hypothetical protein
VWLQRRSAKIGKTLGVFDESYAGSPPFVLRTPQA